MELFKASNQWATRPEDQKFYTIGDAYQACLSYKQTAVEKADVQPSTLRVQADGNDILLYGKGDRPARLTHWAFGQLSQRIAAPAGYLRGLPATLAAQNMNHGLKARYGTVDAPTSQDETVNLLVHSNGGLLVRAFTSERYSRIWNHDILRRMQDFEQHGWTTPKPFEFSGGSGWGGDQEWKKEPTIYVSDHDIFVFMVNNDNRLREIGNAAGLGRGFFVENSEVGASKLKVTTFLYRFVCCNHIVWGAQEVFEVGIRHVGSAVDKANKVLDQLEVQLTKYANESASDDEAKIEKLQKTVIGANKEEVLDTLFNKLKNVPGASRKVLTAGYDMAELNRETDGDPNTIWGMVNGVTRYSQTVPFADERTTIDRAAAKLVDLAF